MGHPNVPDPFDTTAWPFELVLQAEQVGVGLQIQASDQGSLQKDKEVVPRVSPARYASPPAPAPATISPDEPSPASILPYLYFSLAS